MTNSEPIVVGVLLCSKGVQFLDVAAVDLLGMCTPEYLKACQLPETIVSQGRLVEIRYVAETGAGSHIPTTSNAKILITHSFDNVGKLDYLIIPGPDPSYQATAAEKKFIVEKFQEVSKFLTICSGMFPALQSGVLNGRRATAPRPIVPKLKQSAPVVEWSEKRWEVDDEGKVWSSGGVTNGNDMIAAFIKKTLSPELASIVCMAADTGERSQEFDSEAPTIFGAGGKE